MSEQGGFIYPKWYLNKLLEEIWVQDPRAILKTKNLFKVALMDTEGITYKIP